MMFIPVTPEAGWGETHECFARIDMFVRAQCQVSNQFRQVAVATLQGGVFSFERKAGQRVIELLFAILPIDQFEIESLVFDMAGLTHLILRPAVQTFVRLPLRQNPPVACQTSVRRQLLVGAVTLGAVLHPFEKRVRAVKLTGRDLTVGPGNHNQDTPKYPERYPHYQTHP